jgi:tight adherence protein B
MTGPLLALVFALGAALAYDGLVRPAAAMTPGRRSTRLSRHADQVRVFLRAAGVELPVRTFVGASALVGLACALVAQAWLGWPVITAAAFVLGSGVLAALYSPRAARRRAAERAALPELAERLSAALAAGLSLEEALLSLAATGPEALRPELVRLCWWLRLTDLDTALRAFRDRLADAAADEVIAAVLLGRQVGSRALGTVLARRADASRQGLALRQEGAARQSAIRWQARIIVVWPIVVLIGLRVLAPDFLAIYDDWRGQLVLLGCLVWLIAGYGVFHWLGRLPQERRVLIR